MVRRAGTLMVAVALGLVGCSKATKEGGAAPELASPAGLTNMLTSKLGISESQASMALGALLGEAKGKLSPGDYSKLEGALPGAEHYLCGRGRRRAAEHQGSGRGGTRSRLLGRRGRRLGGCLRAVGIPGGKRDDGRGFGGQYIGADIRPLQGRDPP
jgi:hypothetical protein